MSSSTSSSEPGPDTEPGRKILIAEAKVLLCVLVVVLIGEVAARYILPASLDYNQHVTSIPDIAADLKDTATKENNTSILFVGNSLFWHGLDESVIQEKLGDKASVRRIAPSGSAILDWHYLILSHFVSRDQKPDVAVFGFVAHHIDDSERVKLRTLARYFLTPDRFLEFAGAELDSFDLQSTAFLSMGSSLVGDQPDIRPYMEYYRPWNGEKRTINALLYSQKVKEAGQAGSASAFESFTRLERFLGMLKKEGIRGVFVCMPRVKDWKIKPRARELIEGSGMILIDARNLENISEAEFKSDKYHLNAEGKKRISAFLAEELKKIL